jgi:hypothetical protein
LGYAGNPNISVSALLVPESGLITLCQRCHDALTNCRRATRYEGREVEPIVVQVETRSPALVSVAVHVEPVRRSEEQRVFVPTRSRSDMF